MKTDINHSINRFKRKYYINLILKGTIFTLIVLLSVYLFFILIEYQFHSSSVFRAILFFSYIFISVFVLSKWLLVHIYKLLDKKKQISDDDAARSIGVFFPEIKDKLLNLLQLKKIPHQENSLVEAGIQQKTYQLKDISFDQAIDLKSNIKYLKFLLIPFVIVALLGFVSPTFLTEPGKRIVQFNKEFIPVAPFTFNIKNQELIAFRNEDFEVELVVNGDEIPDNVYLVTVGRKLKLQKKDPRHFKYTFEKIQNTREFRFEAAGYYSQEYTLNVVNRPNIKNFQVELQYPSYLQRPVERLSNVGNFQVPEGTRVKWLFQTLDVDDMYVKFDRDSDQLKLQQSDNQLFEYNKSIKYSDLYTLNLKNRYSNNKDVIKYTIEAIKDEYPKINLDQLQDTVLYNYLIFGGNISDDYGLSELRIYYNNSALSVDEKDYKYIDLSVDKTKNSQSFYYQWFLDELTIKNGEQLRYYLQVKDNDGINGRKATRTPVFTFKVPTKKEVLKDLESSGKNTENQIEKSLDEANKLNEQLKELDNKLKGKKELNWQDQKQIEDLIKRKNTLEEELKNLQDKFDSDMQKRERFDQKQDDEMKEKVQQLQKLMDELLDEETKELYRQLQELLEEKKNINDIKDVIKDLNFKEENFKKELERSLELFKKMKFEMKLQDELNKLNDLEEEQRKASEESKDKKGNQESLQMNQEQLNEQFKEIQKELDELEKLNQDLKHPQPLEDYSEEEQQIEKSQKEAQQNLQQNQNKKASQQQQNAADQMKQLSQKLQAMQSMMMQQSMQMNLNQLRDILDNLIKLSFYQEDLMTEFRNVKQSDPRFIELSQNQLKVKDDAKVIQDSLISLSKKDFRLESIVTREVDEMNRYLDEASEAIKERKKGEVIGKQQFAMTSINNLALLLDDLMSQMMNAMGMGGGQPQNTRTPSMSELQKQLSEQISKLKESGKSGRQLSEELAEMAAEQERIREMLKELQDELEKGNNGTGGNSLEDIKQKMEQSEIDLVNKRLTEQLIKRQQEIVTRLLEAENSMRERDLDKEREAEHAKDFQRKIPIAFEEYIKLKEKEIELLKTVPPKLNPYYKKEVNDYFKRIGSL